MIEKRLLGSPIGTVELEIDPKSGDLWSCRPAPDQTPVDAGTMPILERALMECRPPGEPYTLRQEGPSWAPQFWEVLIAVPRGETITYGELCQRCGLPRGYARAVGHLLGQNRLAPLIPCHRVIRSDSTSGEYHWGSALKQRLLKYEQELTQS